MIQSHGGIDACIPNGTLRDHLVMLELRERDPERFHEVVKAKKGMVEILSVIQSIVLPAAQKLLQIISSPSTKETMDKCLQQSPECKRALFTLMLNLADMTMKDEL